MDSKFGLNEFSPPPERSLLDIRETTDTIESYADRDGYKLNFLGRSANNITLPGLGSWDHDDAVCFRTDIDDEYIIPYRHFSVAVAKSRRLPLFSAVNIDGRKEVTGIPRTNIWKRDPRIPLSAQILRECYGREDKGFFSRGHMTRREDPNWGGADEATQADADTFHVTNAAPQAQSFNSPIWLGLENYLLKNAKIDDMKISVFSGPVLSDEDIEMFGVQIPSKFWKIVVFIHDESKKPTATGYLTSQTTQIEGLRQPQFVFGEYRDWQVPISRISSESGLDFSHLDDLDPMQQAGKSFLLRITDFTNIFIK